jgi:hypothetical protein
MGYGEDVSKTRDALAKLGPQAVEILKQRMDGKGASSMDRELEAARDVLDRLGIRRADVSWPEPKP